MIGKLLGGHYEIVDEIGQGGFASVYRALDTKLKRHVAIKILHETSGDRDFRDRFRRESEWLAGFKHPNIVAVYDVDEHEGNPYLVMELVEGSTLIELIRHSTLSADEACHLSEQICRAMAYSHSKGIVHRDLTLRNIMVEIGENEEAAVKILDFGLAKYLHQDVTMAVTTMGTAPYLSPEQIQGEGVDGRADVFAFGVCLFRMLAGRFPFEAEHPSATLYQICHDPDIVFPDDFPARLRNLVSHCLEKRPQDRPKGFPALVDEFKAIAKAAALGPDTMVITKPQIDVATARVANNGNPYLNRVMIRNPEDFYGRKREVPKIYSRLDAAHPQSTSVVGERRIGKSSLLSHIYHPRNRARHLACNADSIFIYLDFQSRVDLDVPGFIEFVFNVFRLENRDLTPPARGEFDFELLRTTIETLHGDGKRIIILLDEFEQITRNPKFDERFFAFLRSLANNYRVAFITSSCDELQNMCHQKAISDSPFFNIFANLPLKPFREDEARQLIIEPSRACGTPLESHADRILAFAGLMPIFLQIGCCSALETLQDDPDDPLDWDAVGRRFMEEAKPHFEFICSRMDETECEILRCAVSGKKIDRKLEFHTQKMIQQGYLVSEKGRIRAFSESFGEYVIDRGGGGRSRNPFRALFGRKS